ncbi:pseudaminic acid cytidylyltransferase [Leucobacter sp. GX24907]
MGERIALIPARGGSTRIPKKNIRSFLGRPALERLVETLRTSGVCDTIVVSTDDDEIAQVARAAGAEVPFVRPQELADEFTGARPVIQHAIRELQLDGTSTLGVFYATAVLLEPDDVTASLAIFEQNEVDFVLSVAEFPAPIARALTKDSAGLMAPVDAGAQAHRSQDLGRAFYDLGQFYWGSAESWLTGTAVVNARTLGYEIEPWRVVDIDTPDDWRRAEALYRVRHERG